MKGLIIGTYILHQAEGRAQSIHTLDRQAVLTTVFRCGYLGDKACFSCTGKQICMSLLTGSYTVWVFE